LCLAIPVRNICPLFGIRPGSGTKGIGGILSVKHQYFGDRRDLLKYSLFEWALSEPSGSRRVSFVVMLTGPDGRSDGGKTSYEAGCFGARAELVSHLKGCLARGKRDVRELRSYFAGRGADYRPYGDEDLFTHSGRDAYFDSIPDDDLDDSLVFLDPDNGLQVKSMRRGNGEKFLLFAEAAGLLQRMGERSLLVIYQHIPRVKRPVYFAHVAGRLREECGAGEVHVLTDNEVAFFLLPKPGPAGGGRLEQDLGRFAATAGVRHYVV
jgi:hypothetical protein